MNESKYHCRCCKEVYYIKVATPIRCPYCDSKERDSLDVDDSDILDLLIDTGAIDLDKLDIHGQLDNTRESLSEEVERRIKL